MKKIIYLAGFVGILSLSCERDQDYSAESILQTDNYKQEEINHYKNWEEFHEAYTKFSKMDIEELEKISFYRIEKDNMQYSPALQAILNRENQVKINNEIIELKDGDFINLNSNKENKKYEKVGSVSSSPIEMDNDINGKKEINLNRAYWELWGFYQQQYISCQTGVNHGSAPRQMRYLHQAFGEYIIAGYQHTYSLFLRLYLEYNYRGSAWRLSGELREISVDIIDHSFFTNLYDPQRTPRPDYSGNPQYYNLRFNSSCSSHKVFGLRTYRNIGPEAGIPIWQINIQGRITQKLTGDVPQNKWVHDINW